MKRITLMLLALVMALCLLCSAPLVMAESIATEPPHPVIDLTPLVQAVVTVISALVAYMLVPWIKAKATTAQYEYLLLVVRTLVFAAGKLYETGKIGNKLMYVQEKLRKRGFDLDIDAIEAMVKELDLEEEAVASAVLVKPHSPDAPA